MVLPAAHAVARMTARRTSGKISSHIRNAERHTVTVAPRLSRVRGREKRNQRTFNPTSRRVARMHRVGVDISAKMAPDNLLGDMAQKAKAYKASITILEPYLTSYLWIQLPFGLFSALAIGHEFFIEGISWGWLNMISPGLVFFYAGFAIVLAQGLISMISAAAVYSIRGVPCFDTNIRLGSFIFCTIGFFVPFLNLLPWTAMWVAAIIWSHR